MNEKPKLTAIQKEKEIKRLAEIINKNIHFIHIVKIKS